MEYIKNYLINFNLSNSTADVLSVVITVLIILLLCILANIIMSKIVLKILIKYIKNNKFKLDDYLVKRKVFEKLIKITPAIIIYFSAPIIPKISELIKRVSLSYILLIAIIVINSLLDTINDIYKTYPVSKVRPIKGFLQIIKISGCIIIGIVIITTLLGQSPLIFLSGVGALTAVFSLLFKDSILGFVAGIQLSANDMLRIGDWIEMPKHGADGFVIDISLNTIKVQNFDKTIVTIPSYSFISDSFKNWRGMYETGARRIKRSIYIDISSIQFCTKEMIEKFKKIQYIEDYIKRKEKEIEKHNKENNINDEVIVNGRHLTNIGTFRAYIQSYLRNHPAVNKELVQMVRQLPPEERGLPLEIYAFINLTDWVAYESIQSDIFDHILAVANEFGIRIFQNPSGYDVKQIRIPE